MYIVRIWCGLGNQLFQYAFIKALSVIHNEEILADTFWFEENTDRKYRLPLYNTQLKYATTEEIAICKNEKQFLNRFHRSLYKRLVSKKFSNIVNEKDSGLYEPSFFEEHEFAYFNGFYQSEKYFSSFRNELLHDFILKQELTEQNKEMLAFIQESQSVSLHIRRGDYLSVSDSFPLTPLEYYEKAIEIIERKIDSPHFFIFSDDMNWVKENFRISHPFTLVEINTEDTDYFELELMRNCKHNIIANSSFSWWGAWLNNNPEKIIIAPEKWFAKKKMISKDIIPSSWIKISL